MSLGERLLELRKKKNLSQEEAAYKLNVTRQTISKWETDQSTPDLAKIMPICELYEVTSEELLTGCTKEKMIMEEAKDNKGKKALGIGFGVLGYFIAVSWIVLSVAFLAIDPVLSTGIFLILCGISTCVIIYTCIKYHKKEEENENVVSDEEENKLFCQIKKILQIATLVIYFVVSLLTGRWDITWLIWLAYLLITEIAKLIFILKENNGDKDEK